MKGGINRVDPRYRVQVSIYESARLILHPEYQVLLSFLGCVPVVPSDCPITTRLVTLKSLHHTEGKVAH